MPMTWSKIHQTFSHKEIPEVKEYHEVYINVKKSWFHKVTTHHVIMPCVETIKCVIQSTSVKDMTFKNIHGV